MKLHGQIGWGIQSRFQAVRWLHGALVAGMALPSLSLAGEEPAPVSSAWTDLVAALQKSDSKVVQDILAQWPDPESKPGIQLIVALIDTEPLPTSLETLLDPYFTLDSPSLPRCRLLLTRLQDPRHIETDPYAGPLETGIAITKEAQTDPLVSFIKRCRLERQIRQFAAITSDRKAYVPLDPLRPFEVGFQNYHPWQDQMFINTEVNERLMRLGSPYAVFFHIQRQSDQRNPMAVFLLQTADRREVQPPHPLWSIPHHAAGPALMIEVDGLSPPGLKGITEPMGGGVSLVFRDPIRADCNRVRQPWPDPPQSPDASLEKLNKAKRYLHDQVQAMYRDDAPTLERDSIALTAVHEAAHQALHDMVGTHIYGPSQYFVFGGPTNGIVEINEILADLAVVNELVKEKDNRKLLLLAFYGLMDAKPPRPEKNVWLDDPYQWKSALILRCAHIRDGVLTVDFAAAAKYVDAWERSLGAALQTAIVDMIMPPIMNYLFERKDLVKDEDIMVNFDRLQGWIEQKASAFKRNRPRLSDTDARTAAVTQVIHDISMNSYPFLHQMVMDLTTATQATQQFLARSLGADLEHQTEFLDFITANLRES